MIFFLVTCDGLDDEGSNVTLVACPCLIWKRRLGADLDIIQTDDPAEAKASMGSTDEH